MLNIATANADMFSIDPKSTIPGIALEAEYDYYGQTGKLSKLRGKHLRPPHNLPVSTVAIVDHLNEALEKSGKSAPEVFITDRLQWGRYQIFSVLQPMANGKQISKPTPVICKRKYQCRVDSYYDSHLNPDQQNLLKWIRFHLKTRYSESRLTQQQIATISQKFKLFSLFDPKGTSTPAINFWLNLREYPSKKPLLTDGSSTSPRLELQALMNLITESRKLADIELNAASEKFNELMINHLGSLFAGQFNYPFTKTNYNFDKKAVYTKQNISATDLVREIRSWHSISPKGYVESNHVRYIIFSVNNTQDNLHIMPSQCRNKLCESISADLIRSNENILLNHPLMLAALSKYFTAM